MFNEICINEEILPKYTYFKRHDPAAHKYKPLRQYERINKKICRQKFDGF